MPARSVPLAWLGFLTIGSFDEADPARGHRTTLEVIEPLGWEKQPPRAGAFRWAPRPDRIPPCRTSTSPISARDGVAPSR